MGKYLVLIKNGAQNIMIYRFNFFAWFAVEGINVLVAIYIWLSVYNQGNTIGSYSLRGLIAYYILSRIIGMIITSDDVSNNIFEDISQGRLTNYVVKPINYCYSIFAKSIGETISAFLLALPVGIFFVYYFRDTLDFSSARLLLFLLSLLIAISLNYIIFFIIGLLTFYIENIFGPIFMSWLLVSLFSGRTAPLDVLPGFLKTLSDFLPFKYTMFVPMQIINGGYSLSTSGWNVLFGFIWLIAFWQFAKLFYNQGLKKYEGYGS